MAFSKTQKKQLLDWYQKNKRDLPWRRYKDPYQIWISETMLQQTTTTAVIPYFQRFLQTFPNLKSLAQAPQEEVLGAWSGLGYYSRARHLHRAAQDIYKQGNFPKTADELKKYSGFGPYTSRAVSSLAFGESVGVLDGNVIRVLSRFWAQPFEWWKQKDRKALQTLADQLVTDVSSRDMNQAVMELGATVCLPGQARCVHCPWLKSCQAHAKELTHQFPLARPQRERENWVWKPLVIQKRKKIALIKNTYAPFLRQQWFLPGQVRQTKAPPKRFQFRHSITHHNIFVCPQKPRAKNQEVLLPSDGIQWVSFENLHKWAPASLVQKTVKSALNF